MNDLIKEEEFVIEKQYNPWKWFTLFYGIALLEAVGIYIFSLDYAEFPEIIDPVMNIYFISAFVMPFIMIFSKNKNRKLPKVIILLASFFLMLAYLFVFVLLTPIFGSTMFSSVPYYFDLICSIVVIFSCVYIVVTLIILYVVYILNSRIDAE